MKDINSIAKDLRIEVDVQGEKLQELDGQVQVAADNAEAANEELMKAKKYSNKKRKCTCWISIILVLILIFAGLILYFTTK